MNIFDDMLTMYGIVAGIFMMGGALFFGWQWHPGVVGTFLFGAIIAMRCWEARYGRIDLKLK